MPGNLQRPQLTSVGFEAERAVQPNRGGLGGRDRQHNLLDPFNRGGTVQQRPQHLVAGTFTPRFASYVHAPNVPLVAFLQSFIAEKPCSAEQSSVGKGAYDEIVQ